VDSRVWAVEASAPGKVILLGEHFVVRGSRALVAAIGLRIRVRARRLDSWPSRIYSAQLGARGILTRDLSLRGPPELEPIAAVARSLEALGVEVAPADIIVEGDLPAGSGLGSSAAVSAAAALALSRLSGASLEPSLLFRVALEGERVVHENPSGVDTAVAVYGGFLVYRRGEEPQSLSLSLPPGVEIVVADSGRKRRTGDVVRHVLRRAEATAPVSDLIYRAADAMVDEAIDALRRGDAARLGALMDLAHGLLAGLGASSPILDALVHAARSAGALGAKLTGAGWGGSIIALVPSSLAGRVAEALVGAGAAWARRASLGVGGVRARELPPKNF
jgi:mevalonate kinase